MVGRVGVEPTSPVFQTGAVTTLATAPSKILERETGFEPAASSLARRRSTTELFPRQTFVIITKIFSYLLLITKSFYAKIPIIINYFIRNIL